MKKTISIISLMLVLNIVQQAQVPDFTWTKTAGGTYSDYGRNVTTDQNGNVIVAGEYYHDFSLGSTAFSGWYNPFIAKMDADGNYLWAVDMGGDMTDHIEGVCVDASGNIYATGMFQGQATFGSETLNGFGNADIFITKLDADGNFIWTKEIGSIDGSDEGYAITSDANGNIYVTGRLDGTATFGSITLTTLQSTMFVTKLDMDGNFLWATNAISSMFVYSYSIAVDGSGNSYVTGNFMQTATFGSTSCTSAGDYDIFITKLDAAGNFEWATASGDVDRDCGYAITADNIGNIYTTGYFQRTASFGPFSFTTNPLYWNGDIFITKMDAAGNFLWAKQAGGTKTDKGFSITTDNNGNIYSSGQFLTSATFGSYTVTGSSTSVVAYVTKLNPAGDFLWAKAFGSAPGNDMAESIAVDNDENIYVAGTFDGTCTFGTNSYTSVGSDDFFITQLAVPTVTTNWTGAVNNDWNIGTNWDNGIPGTSSITNIPDVSGSSGNFPEINAMSNCKILNVSNGSTLTLNPGGKLSVMSTTTNEGSIVMKSDNSNTASLIDHGMINNGVFSIERYSSIPGWHLVGSPVSNAQAGMFTGMYLQSYNETTASWTEIIEETELLNPMQGYGLWTLNTGDVYTFYGNPNSGNISNSLTTVNQYGWNLLSNPYTSGIDWDLVTKPAEINGAIYYLDATTENYVSYNAGLGEGSQYIPPMQGFWVSATGNGNLNFQNNQRTHSGTDNYYKSSESQTGYLVLKATGNNLEDKTYIQFNEAATAAFDGQFDAYKLLSTNPEIPQIFSICGENNLSINRIPSKNFANIGFSSLASAEFTISLDDFEGFEIAVLEDKLENAFVNLFENPYTFQYESGENPDRFIVHFSSLAIEDYKTNSEVTIYAHNSSVFVKSFDPIKSGIIEIYNVTGSKVYDKNISNLQFEKIDLNLVTGNYIVKVIVNTEVYVKKVFLK